MTPGEMTPGQMIPGQITGPEGVMWLNHGATVLSLLVVNGGDRPVQVGSHYHFAESNGALRFDRDAARGHRLDIPAGTSVRFEPGIERMVALIPLRGDRIVAGLRGEVTGPLDPPDPPAAAASSGQPTEVDHG